MKTKPKFQIIILYGPPAVGKHTVAKELSKKTGYRLFHNHGVKDLVWEFFPRLTYEADLLSESIVFLLLEQIAKKHINIILTDTHSEGFVSSTGLSNDEYYEQIKRVAKKYKGEVLFVQLTAEKGELIKRVSHKDRKKHKKLADRKIMKQVLEEKDWYTPAKQKNQICIDNTKLTPKKVVNLIAKNFDLKI